MKKNKLLIICIIIIAALGGSCCYFYLNYHNSRQAFARISSESQQYSQKLSDLQESLTEKDNFINGQKEYIKELTEQLNALEELAMTDSEEASGSEPASYQKKYPDLYARAEYEKRNSKDSNKKMVYLTFDDGPSNLTPEVLDLLDEYDAKATFFVVYKEEKAYTDYLSEIVKRGHTLALHSYSHNYKKIYASVDAFLEDFQKVYDWVYKETGQRPTLFRFPGGSTNGKKAVVDEIVKEMERRGFIYYDWNVSSGDGSNLTTTENIIENVTTTVGNHKFPVVLMHDSPGKKATLNALPTVLEYLKDKEYTCSALDETMTPVQYARKGR